MKILIKTTLITALVASTSLFAGSGHSHAGHDHSHGAHGHSHEQKEVSEADIKEIAVQKVNSLVKQKKIAKSWANSPVERIEISKVNYKKDLVVSFKNANIKKKSRQTLYVFVSKSGMVKGANYTGK